MFCSESFHLAVFPLPFKTPERALCQGIVKRSSSSLVKAHALNVLHALQTRLVLCTCLRVWLFVCVGEKDRVKLTAAALSSDPCFTQTTLLIKGWVMCLCHRVLVLLPFSILCLSACFTDSYLCIFLSLTLSHNLCYVSSSASASVCLCLCRLLCLWLSFSLHLFLFDPQFRVRSKVTSVLHRISMNRPQPVNGKQTPFRVLHLLPHISSTLPGISRFH